MLGSEDYWQYERIISKGWFQWLSPSESEVNLFLINILNSYYQYHLIFIAIRNLKNVRANSTVSDSLSTLNEELSFVFFFKFATMMDIERREEWVSQGSGCLVSGTPVRGAGEDGPPGLWSAFSNLCSVSTPTLITYKDFLKIIKNILRIQFDCGSFLGNFQNWSLRLKDLWNSRKFDISLLPPAILDLRNSVYIKCL